MCKDKKKRQISHSLPHPLHPGRGAASALPINTLLAPPFPAGSFGAGLLVVELLTFSFGCETGGTEGEGFRGILSRFSFSGFSLPGTTCSDLAIPLSFVDKLFDTGNVFFKGGKGATFGSVFFSLRGLSSDSDSLGSALAHIGESSLSSDAPSRLSGEFASMRIRESGLGLTGE